MTPNPYARTSLSITALRSARLAKVALNPQPLPPKILR
jgi:hypothetical protein